MNVKDFSIKSDSDVLANLEHTGFQATELARAIALLKEMKRDKDCLKFLAFTANTVASGLRGCFAQLIREGYADIIVTSGGSVDHDIIKSYAPYGLSSFGEDDGKLHSKSVNRIGNILVPNDRYVLLEEKVQPVFKSLYKTGRKTISTSELITELAKPLPKDKNSFLVAAREKGVFVYSPALIDSAIGLQLFFFKQDHRDFVLDDTADLPKIANKVLTSKRTGAFIIGGGPSKHFTLGTNLLKGGLDYSIYLTTAQEFDGSLSGAPPREAKSWGKIKGKASTALVNCDATIALPLIMAGLKR